MKMASMFSRVSAIAAIAAALCGRAALAADMPFLSAPQPAPANLPVEFGSNWYLRADIGYESSNAPIISSDFTANLARLNNATGAIGGGYQFNSWLRADLTIDRSILNQNQGQASVYCPYGNLVNVTSGSTTFQGYLYNPNETCTPYLSSHVNRTSVLANAYLDFGDWWGFTPYVGAGVGLSYLQASSSIVYYENGNGTVWTPNLAQGGASQTWWQYCGVQNQVCQVFGVNQQYPWALINPNAALSKKVVKFAWNLMAGVSYDISQNLKLDLNYRFLDVGPFTSFPSILSGAGPLTKDVYSQEVRLGVRLLTD